MKIARGLGYQSALQAIKSAASDQVRGVYFRSQISPDIDIDPTALMAGRKREFSEGGLSELFLRVAKPSVYVDTTLGSIRIAPWGEPRFNLLPLLLIGTAVGGAVALGLIARGLK